MEKMITPFSASITHEKDYAIGIVIAKKNLDKTS